MQGCGKSLCAKVVASAWRMPLLRMDPGVLYQKYIGESEPGSAKRCSQAESMAPVVLWIDEIEKAFASAGRTRPTAGCRSGCSARSLVDAGRRWRVFVIATANDMHAPAAGADAQGPLRRDLLRRSAQRGGTGTILAIHLRKRKQDPAHFDLQGLARDSDGFSGAELEQVVVSALYAAYSAAAPLTDALLRDELQQMPPIASTAREKITFLRQWADGRTVPAN